MIVAGVVTAPAIAGDGALIADSLVEFTSTQGVDGWYYGYYAADGDPGSFTELCCYDPTGVAGAWWEHQRLAHRG